MTLFEKITSSDYVHVIDDFYPELRWLEEHKRQARFEGSLGVNYPGLTSPPPSGIENILERLQRIIEGPIQFVHYDGQIRVSRKQDQGSEKTRIHTDEGRIIILIYLSHLPAGLSAEAAGTAFLKHKKLKRTRFTPMDPLRDEFQRHQNMKDTKEPELWEEWLRIPFKFNRALIYDGNLYHSPPSVFYGSGLDDGRLTQHFFPVNLKRPY